ncbi:MAG: WecB/TagA/CpsF family glycosyltransferase [bacterium]|nr:WecB/TagA/CpsF family glycosyltransferase [bacterium]
MAKIDILGVKIDNLTEGEVFEAISTKIRHKKKFWIITPNPEFVVAAQSEPVFKKLLNNADLSIPDGLGLVWASNFLGSRPRLEKRIAGSDIVEKIIKLGPGRNWRIGVVGARVGNKEESARQLEALRSKYHGLAIESMEEREEKRSFDFVFACQGMGKQERWISENLKKIDGTIFIGIGGSLDFFSGFSKRAPIFFQKLGLEWLWRLLTKQGHIRRVYRALVLFPWLVLKKKLEMI